MQISRCIVFSFAVASLLSTPLRAQGERGKPGAGGRAAHAAPRPEVGGGHIPARGPERTPARSVAHPAPRPAAQPNYAHGAGHPNAPHVDVRHDNWTGHDVRRDEPGLRLSRPWSHGRFGGEFGPSHVYRLNGGNFRRFGFDGAFFSVAAVDYGFAGDWMWDRDDIVLYADSDHDGYYLA